MLLAGALLAAVLAVCAVGGGIAAIGSHGEPTVFTDSGGEVGSAILDQVTQTGLDTPVWNPLSIPGAHGIALDVRSSGANHEMRMPSTTDTPDLVAGIAHGNGVYGIYAGIGEHRLCFCIMTGQDGINWANPINQHANR